MNLNLKHNIGVGLRVEIPSGKGLTSQPEASLGLSVVMLEVKRRQ